jgi:hypothetical protein
MNKFRFDMTDRVSKLRKQFVAPLPSKKRLGQNLMQPLSFDNSLELNGEYGLLLQENGDAITLNE